MVALGKTSDGASSSTSTATSQVVSSTGAAASSGWLTDGRARVWISATPATNTRFVIYSNSAGAPVNLLAQSDILSVVATSEAERTYTFSGANLIQIVSGTTYWVGVCWVDPGTANFTWSRANTSALAKVPGTAVSAGPTPPATFGTPVDANGAIDAYINYATFTSGQVGVQQRRLRTGARMGAFLTDL